MTQVLGPITTIPDFSTESPFSIWRTDPKHILTIECGEGQTISIDNNGNFETSLECSDVAREVWRVIAAYAPIACVQKNGIRLAQSKLLAISKIRDLLVEKRYEAAEHLATAVLEGKDDV